MNLSDLRYLVALADHRHFGRAAEACFVSQPTLSTQIKKLETELGVPLVERNPRQITLTIAGERIVERARLVLQETENIKGIARQAKDPESATLRVGLFPTIAPYLLPHVIPNVHERFPNLDLLLVEEKTDTIIARLRDGRLDAGILALPVQEDFLDHRYMFSERFLLAVPADSPLAIANGPVNTSTLSKEPVLLLDEGHCLRDQALEVCRLAGASERPGFRATSLETLRQMVAAGVGITLLPELAVRPPVPESPTIRLMEFDDPAPSREIAMFWRKSSVYRDFMPQLASVMGTLAPGLLVGASDGKEGAAGSAGVAAKDAGPAAATG